MAYEHGGDIYTHRNVRDFSANINYFGMPESVRAAAAGAVEDAVHYPDPACTSLRRALAKREWETNNYFGILTDDILCANGATELLFALAGAYRPKRALLAVPSFHEYEQVLLNAGCEIEQYRCRPEQAFALGEDFRRAAADFVRSLMTGAGGAEGDAPHGMMILANPNNPTGRLIDADLLHSLIALCRESHVLLVLDESFIDFLNAEDQNLTFSGAEEAAENPYLFVIRSFTKIYAMPGLRFGYAICSDHRLLAAVRDMLQPWNVSVVAQAAAKAAAGEYAFATRSAREISFNRKEVVHLLQKADYHVFPSSANFVLLRGPEDLADYCLQRGFLIRDCVNFTGLDLPRGQGYFRICIRSQQENRELMQVLYHRAGLAFDRGDF